MEEFSGIIERIVFSNEENGYSVVKVKHGTDLMQIVGHFTSLQLGENISCKGTWVFHPKYGKQFDVASYKLTVPTDTQSIQKYLASGNIKGIGPVHAERIVAKFGLDTLSILDESPNRLKEIEG